MNETLPKGWLLTGSHPADYEAHVERDAFDGARKASLAFDNMQNRPIQGTDGWTRYAVVLDVPEGESTVIAFGVLLLPCS